ncbi:hypothetical protein, partial [Vibrio atlanticus]|uniref:hypothetical protein n=1 Tax=Vibrio atlanticus TaxID=693153 RepID=UPI00354FAD32
MEFVNTMDYHQKKPDVPLSYYYRKLRIDVGTDEFYGQFFQHAPVLSLANLFVFLLIHSKYGVFV